MLRESGRWWEGATGESEVDDWEIVRRKVVQKVEKFCAAKNGRFCPFFAAQILSLFPPSFLSPLAPLWRELANPNDWVRVSGKGSSVSGTDVPSNRCPWRFRSWGFWQTLYNAMYFRRARCLSLESLSDIIASFIEVCRKNCLLHQRSVTGGEFSCFLVWFNCCLHRCQEACSQQCVCLRLRKTPHKTDKRKQLRVKCLQCTQILYVNSVVSSVI